MTSLFNDGKCILIRTDANSVTAECALCGRGYDSLDVTPGMCKNPVAVDTVTAAIATRIPNIAIRAINYSRFFITEVLIRRAIPASSDLIDERFEICTSNVCGLFVNGVCSDCGCFVNRKLAHQGANKAAWKSETCKRGYWDSL